MPGKRVQFDDETWAAIDALARERGISFQDLTDEAFSDLLKKPVSRSGSRPTQGERRRAAQIPLTHRYRAQKLINSRRTS